MSPNNPEYPAPLNQAQPTIPPTPLPTTTITFTPQSSVVSPTVTYVAPPQAMALDQTPIPPVPTEQGTAPVLSSIPPLPTEQVSAPVPNTIPAYAIPQPVAAYPNTTAGLSPQQLKKINHAGLAAVIVGWINTVLFVLVSIGLAVAHTTNTKFIIVTVLSGIVGVINIKYGHRLKKYNPQSTVNVKQTLYILSAATATIMGASLLMGDQAGLINFILMFFIGSALSAINSRKPA